MSPRPHRRPLVHLVNPLWDPNGGADLRTLETWRILRDDADVRLWSEYEPSAALACRAPIRRIVPCCLAWPRGGTLVFVGVYFRIGHWVHLARPQRLVIVYNTDQPDRLQKNLRRLAYTGCEPEIAYTSAALRRKHDAQGPVIESPIDVERFVPALVQRARPFTVGRLSRDVRTKHGDDDPALWRALARAGCRVRIMGGCCLAGELASEPGVELIPAGAEEAASFLRSLDCFVYRTSGRWFEAYGRVVVEAMACGLPVVACERGGYADALVHQREGLLFTTTAEAIRAVLELRARPAWRAALGQAARERVERTHRLCLPLRTREFLLGSPAVLAVRQVSAGAHELRPIPAPAESGSG